jgi:hypothetical protein
MRLRDVGTAQLFVNFGGTGFMVRAFVAAGGSSIAPGTSPSYAQKTCTRIPSVRHQRPLTVLRLKGHFRPLHIRKVSLHTVLPAMPLTSYTVLH